MDDVNEVVLIEKQPDGGFLTSRGNLGCVHSVKVIARNLGGKHEKLIEQSLVGLRGTCQ